MKTENTLTIVALALGLILYSGRISKAVVVTPGNVILPTSAGETLGFDLVLADAMDTTAAAFQVTVGVSGPGTLTFNGSASGAVSDDPGYWTYKNSYGATTHDLGGNWYDFGDNPRNPVFEALDDGDIMARFYFTWDGTPGDYTFTIDFDTGRSFVLNDVWVTEALQFTPGSWPGDAGSFILTPEPATLMLLALGGMAVLRKRNA